MLHTFFTVVTLFSLLIAWLYSATVRPSKYSLALHDVLLRVVASWLTFVQDDGQRLLGLHLKGTLPRVCDCQRTTNCFCAIGYLTNCPRRPHGGCLLPYPHQLLQCFHHFPFVALLSDLSAAQWAFNSLWPSSFSLTTWFLSTLMTFFVDSLWQDKNVCLWWLKDLGSLVSFHKLDLHFSHLGMHFQTWHFLPFFRRIGSGCTNTSTSWR